MKFLKFGAWLIYLSFLASSLSAGETNRPSCCTNVPSAQAVSDTSLYQVDSTWTADSGQSVKLATLRGRPQIVTMFFSTCVYACPLLVNDMKRIEAALPEQVRTNVGFVLVSFDSTRDTPSTLNAYRSGHQLPPNWTLLHGQDDDIAELAALLGIKFKKDASGNFAHSNVITLLNKNGEIVSQQIGLNVAPDEMAGSVQKLFVAAE
jgi:protein SCO1